MRTSNPLLSERTFQTYYQQDELSDKMTISGTVNKSLILWVILLFTASFSWMQGAESPLFTWMVMGGAIGGLAVAVLCAFKKEWSPIIAPIYAALQGLFLGGVSMLIEKSYPGIVPQAVALTLGVFVSLLFSYKSGYIKATENLKLGIVSATGAIALVYMVSMGLRIFGMEMPFIHESGWIGIGFSIFVVVIAALNLVLDFDFIEKGVENHSPKWMEWYASFGLMVTLVWLYIEILRLLVKIAGRK